MRARQWIRDDKLFYPPKFDPDAYVTWERTFENYLDSLKGKSKIPLSYIIRPAGVDPAAATSDYQRMIWQAPHVGYAFEEDNREVYRIYKDLMIGTDGWTWFHHAPEGNGRSAHILISEHYRGTAETARRASEAEARLANYFILGRNRCLNLKRILHAYGNVLNSWRIMIKAFRKPKR
jgi:hypothetical protein